jgi:hypothetical protein
VAIELRYCNDAADQGAGPADQPRANLKRDRQHRVVLDLAS